MAKLTFILEDGQEVEVPLRETITIGRSEGNSVVVDDERISPFHAEVLITSDARIQVREVDEGAGTFVNEERVQSYPLRHGDRLAFGPLVALLDTEEASLPPSAKVDLVETNAHKEAVAAQEKRLAELQASVNLAEAEQVALRAAIKSLATEKDEKTAALQLLNSSKDAVSIVMAELSAQQEKAASRLKQLCDEVAQEEQKLTEARQQAAATLSAQQENGAACLRQLGDEASLAEQKLAGLKQQVATLEATCQQLEALVKAHQGKVDSLSIQIQERERHSAQVQYEIQAAEVQLTEIRSQCAEAEGRSSHLTSTLTALDEEHASLTELLVELQDDITTQRACLKSETLHAETAKALRDELEAQCRAFSVANAQLLETPEVQLTTNDADLTIEAESPPDSPVVAVRTNRIVPRMVATTETITPRPRGIPMKSERITRKGSPIPNGSDI